jgi:hypothetical protein
MAEFIISEKQLGLIKNEFSNSEKLQQAEAIWQSLTLKEKKQIFEAYVSASPNKHLLQEKWGWADYLQTAGDIVGIFDPTGIVDLVNGIAYILRGQTLFGLLSIISAIPYAGDVVAKPVMGILKAGKPSAKALNTALDLAKAGKTAEAASILSKAVETGGITGKFVSWVGTNANRLRSFLERVPTPMFKGLKKTIFQWFDLFENAVKAGKPLRAQGQTIVKGMTGQRFGNTVVRWNKATQISKLEELIKATKATPGIFSGYRTTKGFFSWKTVFGGLPQLMGRNRSVRALMRQTKWWLGFLDWMGIANFVGPDELSDQIGEDEMQKKMQAYNGTDEAQQNFQDDFGQAINQEGGTSVSNKGVGYGKIAPLFNAGGGTSQPTVSTNTSTSQAKEDNPIQSMFRKMFFSEINPLPG